MLLQVQEWYLLLPSRKVWMEAFENCDWLNDEICIDSRAGYVLLLPTLRVCGMNCHPGICK